MAEGGKEALLSKLIDSVPALLIVAGGVLIVLGLAGGITYNGWLPITELPARIGACALGIVGLSFGVYFWKATKGPMLNATVYGIRIEHPKDGDRLHIVDVRGTIKKSIPQGYGLRVFRIYPGSDNFTPVGSKARIEIEKGTWEADHCHVGGKTGDRRALAAFIVGPSGAALIEYHNEAMRVHRKTLDQLRAAGGGDGDFLPSIELRTEDMAECHRIAVWRL